jgi:pimeloyl-ACP methyl ester carboxylesterase
MICKHIIFSTLLFSASFLQAQDFHSADLPDAMTFLDGKVVKSMEDWLARKAEIQKLWCDYFIGNYPEEVPELLSAKVVRSTTYKDSSTRKRVILTFDTPNKKSFEIAVWEPEGARGEPMPLLLTQPRNYHLKWAEEALKRGYIACLYPGLDVHHTEEDYPGYQLVWEEFKKEYPEASWNSSLGIQAWLASRSLDYLLNPEYGYPVDTSAVGIAGFSRYGKQSIYAGAFDERFKCVVTRSSGTPTACAHRFSDRSTFMECVIDFPRTWVIDELRDFYGRENELPIEGNALLACIAPRYLMLHTAYNDGSEPTFGVERNYLNAKKAYQFLGKKENICLSYRKGNHAPVTDEHIKHMFDFFDMAFYMGAATPSDFPEVLIHNFNWEEWRAKQRNCDLNISKGATIVEKIEWMLGEVPTSLENEGEYHIKAGSELPLGDKFRERWNPGEIKRVTFSFCGNMHGNILYDPNRDMYKGTVIWLHPWNYSHASNEGYGVQGMPVYYRLAKEGYKVVMYDQYGFGDHLTNAFGFYDRYPHWTKLGRAVYDVSKVLDYLTDGKGIASEPIQATDPSKIFVCGFSFGGMVGLYAAALDDRITGVASFSGFTPMRTDTDASPTGGIRKYWEWHAILPKLGLYHEEESKIPFDYEDIIRLIAPRKCLIYSPARDRYANIADVMDCIAKASAAWDCNGGLVFKSPDDICRFQRDQQDVLVSWLEQASQ